MGRINKYLDQYKIPWGKSISFTPLVNMSDGKFEDLVRSLAKQYRAPGVPEGDLQQEARIAVFLAKASWTPSKEPTEGAYKNYVALKIRDALKEYRRKNRDEAISLDETISDDADGCEMTLHDVVGTPPVQEYFVQKREEEAALHKLSAEQRTVIALHREGKSHAEIGIAIGKTAKAVEHIWARVQAHIQRAGS